MCKSGGVLFVVVVLIFTFMNENCCSGDLGRLEVNRKGINTTMDTTTGIDENAEKMTLQQQTQHQHHHEKDGLLLVLLPVSTDLLPETSSIEILSNLPRNGFLVRTTLEFSLVLPEVSSSSSRTPPLRIPFSMLQSDLKADTRRTTRRQNEAVQHSHYGLERTSIQAKRHNCAIATNAGPFNKDGSCVGTVVVNGQIIQNDKKCGILNNSNSSNSSSSSSSVGFGITAGPVRNWVLGSLASDNDIQKLGIVHFVTGFDWLVQDGVNVAAATGRNNTTGAERAPRTSIGIDNQGKLVILVTDGCELCFRNQGLTLEELANVLIEHNVQYAINLDGGSSSTLVHKGKLVNRPSCLDLPLTCQRQVASVVCLKSREINVVHS